MSWPLWSLSIARAATNHLTNLADSQDRFSVLATSSGECDSSDSRALLSSALLRKCAENMFLFFVDSHITRSTQEGFTLLTDHRGGVF